MENAKEYNTIELTDGVWAVITSIIPPDGGGPNAGFVISGNEVLLVDSLMSPACGRRMLDCLRKITDKPPTYLINTHHHGDHAFGNEVFSPPATVIAHEYVHKSIVSRASDIVRIFTGKWHNLIPDIGTTQMVAPHITYKESMSLYVAGRHVELIHLGVAHSRGDTIVYLPDDKILFAGDIFLNGILPPIFGSSQGLIEALEQIERMDIETVVPGHGGVATKQDVADFKQALIKLRDDAEDCFLRNLTVAEAVKDIDLSYLGWYSTERLYANVRFFYSELAEDL
jgi:cyclase